MADLTVIIPTIGRDTLGRAVRSVVGQTKRTLTVIEPDPDRTGCGPTLNRALPRVETEWVATMGDDDVLHQRYAEWVAEYASADMVILQMRLERGLSILPQVRSPSKLRFGNVGASYALRTSIAREIGWIGRPSVKGEIAEDWSMIEAVRERGRAIVIVPRIAYFVRP